MGLRVNTNVASVNAQRHLLNTSQRYARNMERLTSGLRINRASDDAAGLAISEALRSDIRALGQTRRNAADGISLVQTAEGALDEVSSILVRMRELAQQSATEVLGTDERDFLNQEFVSLSNEISRIANTVNFNGLMLLNGDSTTIDIHVGMGASTSSMVTLDISTPMTATALGLDTAIISGPDGANALAATTQVLAATTLVSEARAEFGSSQNRIEASIRNSANVEENLSAANSRIRDLDIASETASMTSNQIMQQAGISILSQANMTAQIALTLLQGQAIKEL